MLNILGEAHGDLGVKLAHELMGRAFEVGHILVPSSLIALHLSCELVLCAQDRTWPPAYEVHE